MDTINVKDHVSGGQKAFLKFYRGGILYYQTEKGLMFEIPISDCGDACFNAEERAITLMRWIRKQIDAIKQGEVV